MDPVIGELAVQFGALQLDGFLGLFLGFEQADMNLLVIDADGGAPFTGRPIKVHALHAGGAGLAQLRIPLILALRGYWFRR